MLRIVSLWRHVPIHTIVFLKLDFEPQKRGHGGLGRVETGQLARRHTDLDSR